jgi:hypothetical protein
MLREAAIVQILVLGALQAACSSFHAGAHFLCACSAEALDLDRVYQQFYILHRLQGSRPDRIAHSLRPSCGERFGSNVHSTRKNVTTEGGALGPLGKGFWVRMDIETGPDRQNRHRPPICQHLFGSRRLWILGSGDSVRVDAWSFGAVSTVVPSFRN